MQRLFSLITLLTRCSIFKTKNKLITILVIRPFDDRTYCVRFAFTQLGLWRKLYDCSSIKFRDRKCRFKRALFTFLSISNGLDAITKWNFSTPPPVWGVRGDVGVRDRTIRKPTHGLLFSYYLPIDTHRLSLTVLVLFSWLQKRFRPPARPSARPTRIR